MLYGVKLDPEYVNIVYTVAVVAIIWITCAEHTGITKAGKIYTTKGDKKNHGLGIKNIENTLRRYNGHAEYKVEDNCFVSKIMVKSNRSSGI